jgi:hypothetical protein
MLLFIYGLFLDDAVGTETGYGLTDRGTGARVLAEARIFTSLRRKNRFWIHSASYPMGTAGTFPGGKVAGAWSWPLTSNYCRGQEKVDLVYNS